MNKTWTHTQEIYLIDHFGKSKDADIATALDKTIPAVHQKAIRMCLTKNRRSKWSDDEIKTLKENRDLPLDELCKLIPAHSKKSIKTKRVRLH